MRFRLPGSVLVCVCLLATACGEGAREEAKPTPATVPSVQTSPSTTVAVCTITGTRGDDRLDGTHGDDVICGLGGNDEIRGGGGDDEIRGGKGDDLASPGAGDDRIDGGPGMDVVDLSNAPGPVQVDLREGTAVADGADTLTEVEGAIGTPGDDTFLGSVPGERFDGAGGDDRIRGGAGDDLLSGGDGDDVLLGEAGVDTCEQGPGNGRSVHCERDWVPVPLADAAGLVLHVPAADPLLLAYHESLFDTAIAMKPVGDPKTWMIQPSRGRGTPPTSAVDIPLTAGTPVVAPVDGRVVAVVDYRLYCEAADTLVVIRPTDDPKVSVEVLHLVDVHLRKGQPVFAGGTVLGQPHVFPGGSNQVDAYVPGNPPHVHVEVEADGSMQVPDCDYPRGRSA